LHGRQQERHQRADDRDHHQQFNKRKALQSSPHDSVPFHLISGRLNSLPARPGASVPSGRNDLGRKMMTAAQFDTRAVSSRLTMLQLHCFRIHGICPESQVFAERFAARES
jgi:hypothetical protein